MRRAFSQVTLTLTLIVIAARPGLGADELAQHWKSTSTSTYTIEWEEPIRLTYSDCWNFSPRAVIDGEYIHLVWRKFGSDVDGGTALVDQALSLAN